jgi:ATP-dependent RNA helicase RhlE
MLILAPTRELASQIANDARAYGRNMRLRTTVVVGGMKPRPQIKALAQGVDIVVATPGRLEDHMAAGAVSLAHTEVVVLDEADQMFDLGFFPVIRRLMAQLPQKRQTVMFSATMPKPIVELAQEFLKNPAQVAAGPTSKPIEKIDQRAIPILFNKKSDLLAELLSEETTYRAIVFTRTKHGADRVCRKLEEAGFAASAIHGDKTQVQRVRALSAFRDGHMPILVATDIAARGIHVENVSHVINFDVPVTPEAYVHRIGRTARAGKEGIAITFYDPSERGLIRDIERLINFSLLPEGEGGADPRERANRSRGKKPGHGPSSRRRGDSNRRPNNGNDRAGNAAKPVGNKRPKKRRSKVPNSNGN